jgi:predicted DNA-binding transcriptional regulator AlpA
MAVTPMQDVPTDNDSQRYLPAKQVCERFNISLMTLWRWVSNSAMGFPRPIYINRRRYFVESEITQYVANQRVAQ